MSDTTGQCTNGFHLLCLQKLGFQFLLLAYISDVPLDPFNVPVLCSSYCGSEKTVHLSPVHFAKFRFIVFYESISTDLLLNHRSIIRVGIQLPYVNSNGIFSPIPDQFKGRLVYINKNTLITGDEDGISRLFEKCTIFIFALPKGFLCSFPRRNVHQRCNPAQGARNHVYFYEYVFLVPLPVHELQLILSGRCGSCLTSLSMISFHPLQVFHSNEFRPFHLPFNFFF